ncbi:MAG TPA: serine/threonine-protein kinase [Gemmatimonadaceae bacterium]|nr:serine/threonine-protein kinase [Gemmatimonadaceae bacterium]
MPNAPEFDSLAAALAGQYELEREIGRGGMGVVYLARDVTLDRQVAIKTLPPHLASDPSVRARFLREARTAAKLSHPNIVPIYRADEIDGHVFFAMGYVDGPSIADLVRERTHVDAREVLRHMRDVASALGYASAHGVIHRDVKAENILVERASGRAMVTDFGIARLAEAAPLTATGQVLGTVYYMSPEQVSGESIDGRSDLYSLGVVGYYELTGRFPFDAAMASAVLVAHVNKTAPPVLTIAPSAPRALAEVIDRCLAKDPAARFASGDEMADALARIEPEVARDAARLDAMPYAPKLVSDTEAQQIWDRAAALQAQTGIVPRPAPNIASRDLVADATRTSGYALSAVRDAAVEAGIPAQYVDHAMAEHGLARAGVPSAPAVTVADRSAPPSRLLGAPTNVEYEAVVNGEMPEGDFDLLVDTIRRRMEMAGAVNAVGRSLTWTTLARNRSAHVSIVSRNGKTTIRIAENMEALARRARVLGAVGGGYLIAGAVPLLARVFATPDRMGMSVGLAALAVGAVGALGAAARYSFSNSVKKRQRRFRGLLDELAQQAQDSVETSEEQRKLKP